MKRLGNRGFALMGVLMLLFVFLLFLSSLMSSAKFRNRAELFRIEKMEASYAAEAVVDMMVCEVFKEGICFLEDGVEPMETMLIFEADNGRDEVQVPVILWSERDELELCLCADVKDGEKRASASAVLHYVEIAESSVIEENASYEETEMSGIWTVVERSGR